MTVLEILVVLFLTPVAAVVLLVARDNHRAGRR